MSKFPIGTRVIYTENRRPLTGYSGLVVDYDDTADASQVAFEASSPFTRVTTNYWVGNDSLELVK